jgi:hypothetical protein
MAGTKVGPINVMIRADSTMIGKDMEQVSKQINLKGSLLRINPALGALGFGMDKKLMKGLVRELPGMLGQGGMAGLGGALGSAAGVLGPAGLVLGLMETAWHKMISLADAADPQAVKDYNKVWEDLTAISAASLSRPSKTRPRVFAELQTS